MAERLLDVKNLKTYFFTDEGMVRAVDGVDLYIEKGETLGVVGESGCGKSVTALSVMKLIPQPPGKIVEGEIIYSGQNLVDMPANQMRKIRGKEISMIFQEPMTSLNPVFTVGEQIAEALRLHEGLGRRAAMDKTVEMLKLVHIPNAERRVKEYPHQLSGGMRQRIMIAMALSCNPKLLIADEPTTALDDPAGRLGDQLHDAERRHRLAATGLAHHAERLALVDVEIDAVDRPHHAFVGEEVRLEVLDVQQAVGHGVGSPLPGMFGPTRLP